MVSKSANYCFTSPANPTGILALGEVRSSPLDLIGKESELAHARGYHRGPYGQSLTTALRGCVKRSSPKFSRRPHN